MQTLKLVGLIGDFILRFLFLLFMVSFLWDMSDMFYTLFFFKAEYSMYCKCISSGRV